MEQLDIDPLIVLNFYLLRTIIYSRISDRHDTFLGAVQWCVLPI